MFKTTCLKERFRSPTGSHEDLPIGPRIARRNFDMVTHMWKKKVLGDRLNAQSITSPRVGVHEEEKLNRSVNLPVKELLKE
jgi:hypothetical protein